MKKVLFILICSLSLIISCTKETPRAELLEYNIDGQLYTYKGYAYRYTDYNTNNISQGYDWHIYNLGQGSLYIQAYDSTYTKTIYAYPAFEAKFTCELADGKSKIYQATTGEFRILGQEMGDVLGDFHLKVKNIQDPLDSLMITAGYYRIWLERSDRIFTK
jgi:hypothetical protein